MKPFGIQTSVLMPWEASISVEVGRVGWLGLNNEIMQVKTSLPS